MCDAARELHDSKTCRVAATYVNGRLVPFNRPLKVREGYHSHPRGSSSCSCSIFCGLLFVFVAPSLRCNHRSLSALPASNSRREDDCARNHSFTLSLKKLDLLFEAPVCSVAVHASVHASGTPSRLCEKIHGYPRKYGVNVWAIVTMVMSRSEHATRS